MHIECPRDTYNDQRGQDNQGACQSCPDFSESPLGSPSMSLCACRKGYYNSNSTEYPRCAPCPAGTICVSEGTTTSSLQSAILPGFYRRSSLSAEIRRCPDYRSNDTDRSSCSPIGEPLTDLGCREWTDGAFCQQCNVTDGSRYFSLTTSSCKVCTGSTANPLVAGAVLVVVLAGLALLYNKFRPHERLPWFQMVRLRAVTVGNSISLRAKVKQVVGFYQVVTNIQEVYSIEMPATTQSFLDSIKGVVSFDVVKTFGLPLECASLSGFARKLTFMMLWPIIFVGMLLFGNISKQWFGLLRSLKRPPEDGSTLPTTRAELWAEGRKRAKLGVLNFLPAVSIITFLAFPTVSSVAFRAWACVDFDMDTKYDSDNAPLPRAEPDIQSFMRDDLSIQCGGADHDAAVRLACLAIVLYPIGIPLLYLLLLIKARGAITTDRPTRLSSALSFLHRDFEARMYGWEIAEQGKKLFLVGIMVRVRNDTIVQLGVAMIFTMVFMLTASIASPYRKKENDYFAVTCNFSLTAIFLFCTMLKVKTVAETLDPGELYDRLYFDDFVIGGCLFVCVFGALIMACALSVQTIIEAARVPTFRLAATGNRPELALAKGHKWHLFLSHIWGTGQDQCATIKRQLCLLLIGVQVFLDVDDLEDIGAPHTGVVEAG